MSQITSYNSGSGPGSGTVTSVTGGTGITITGTPTIAPVVNLTVPVVIANGGTNATSFTNTDGVVYFDGTRLVDTAVGTAGQVLTSNGVGLAPTFQNAAGGVASVTAGTGITITGTGTNPIVNLTVPVSIANGGTNATSFTNTDGVVYYDGTRLVTTPVGTSTFVLTSQGAGNPPVFQANAATITFNTNSGSATPTASTISILGSHGLNTSGAVSTVTVAINNAITLGDLSSIVGSPALTATTGDVTLSAGNINLPATTVLGTAGELTFAGVRWLSARGVNNVFVGDGSGSTTLNVGSSTDNVGVGSNTLIDLTTGAGNTCVGFDAGGTFDSSNNNTAIGFEALANGSGNTNNNIALGYQAGSAYSATTESNNIVIGNAGVASETNTIHIGTQGAGTRQQNKCFVAGIVGVSPANPQFTTINSSTGQLGVSQGLATTAGGLVTNTKQSAFHVYQSTSPSNVTGDGTAYTLALNTTVFDQNSDFNTGTFTFTAPITGKYFFNSAVIYTNVVAQTTMQIQIITTSSTYNGSYISGATTFAAGNFLGGNMALFTNMTAADTCIFSVTAAGSTKTVGVDGARSFTYAGGYLVC